VESRRASRTDLRHWRRAPRLSARRRGEHDQDEHRRADDPRKRRHEQDAGDQQQPEHDADARESHVMIRSVRTVFTKVFPKPQATRSGHAGAN
jgi:hypothetical protein